MEDLFLVGFFLFPAAVAWLISGRKAAGWTLIATVAAFAIWMESSGK